MATPSARDMLMQVQRYANGGTASAESSVGLARALASGTSQEQYYKNIREYVAKNPNPLAALNAASENGVSMADINSALGTKAATDYFTIDYNTETAPSTNVATGFTSALAQRYNAPGGPGQSTLDKRIREISQQYAANTPENAQILRDLFIKEGASIADVQRAGVDPSVLLGTVAKTPGEPKLPVIPAYTPPVVTPETQTQFPQPTTYTATPVYQPLPAPPPIYATGQPALDADFRNSAPRSAYDPYYGYMYTPAAKLLPATGAGMSWTPPSVTSRPRELLKVPLVTATNPQYSASQQFARDAPQRAAERLAALTASGGRFSGMQAPVAPPLDPNAPVDPYAVKPTEFRNFGVAKANGGEIKKSEGSAQEELARFANGGSVATDRKPLAKTDPLYIQTDAPAPRNPDAVARPIPRAATPAPAPAAAVARPTPKAATPAAAVAARPTPMSQAELLAQMDRIGATPNAKTPDPAPTREQTESRNMLDRLAAASAVDQEVYKTTGMEPGLDRAAMLPFAGTREQGNLQFAAPQMLYDLAKAAVAPGVAASGRQVSNEDVLNLALNLTGGSLGASQIAGPAAEAGTQMLGMAVKNKGGNWMDKTVAEEIAPLKARVMGQDPAIRLRDVEEAYAQNVEAGVPVDDAFMQRMREQTMPDIAINNWLDTKLNSYIRNDMGTPEDPVRALAERGTLHTQPRRLWPQDINELSYVREMEGFPGAGLGQSELAQRWEAATDTAIAPGQAQNYLFPVSTERYPWLLKVPPETKVYDLAVRKNMSALGFNHLVDELRNAARPDTDLPERLRIDYKKLDRMTVPQIVEKVADINAYRAEKADAANFARSTNAAVQVVKDYPDTNLGWRQIRMPEGETDTTALQEALKYEGDSMGHSVGGYARKGGYGHGGLDAILDGRAQVFSLRDSRGQPHVTIEIKKPELKLDDLRQHLGNDENLVEDYLIKGHQARQAAGDSDTRSSLGHAIELAGVPQGRYQITQVKGKGNGMPAEKYLPAIQDFVRSGNYEVTGDLQNTGLYSAKEIVNFLPKNLTMSRNTRQLAIGRARQANDLPDYLTMPEYEAVLMKYVPEDIWQAEKTKRAAEDDELFRQLRPPEEFAGGGSITKKAKGGNVERVYNDRKYI